MRHIYSYGQMRRDFLLETLALVHGFSFIHRLTHGVLERILQVYRIGVDYFEFGPDLFIGSNFFFLRTFICLFNLSWFLVFLLFLFLFCQVILPSLVYFLLHACFVLGSVKIS